jgi:alpha-glucosidase
LHNFHTTQPDLNFHKEQVQAALLDEVEFWLRRGVDGFRLDTTNFYYCSAGLEDNPPAPPDDGSSHGKTLVNPYHWQQHIYDSNRPENLIFLRRLRGLLDRYPGRTTVGEIGSGVRSLELMAAYTSGGDKLHMCYTFDFLGPVFGAQHFRSHIEAFEAIVEDGWPCWAFSNHDVVRHVSRWAYHGGGERVARLAPAILLALRGSVCLYQGEELGLTEAELEFEQLVDPYGMRFWPEIKGRDGCRTPMVWEADAPNGGFSTGHPWLPVALEHLARAADRSAADPASTLSHYKRLLAFRRAHSALRSGTIRILDTPPDTLGFLRTGTDESIVCLFNLGPSEAQVDLPPGSSLKTLDGHGFGGWLTEDRCVQLPVGEAFFGAIV